MTAELLREAAALMRERAEGSGYEAGTETDPSFTLAHVHGSAIGDHYSSWHPAVALAVADWLDNEAAAVDSLAAAGVARQFDSAWVASETDKRHGSALAVARNYLGRP